MRKYLYMLFLTSLIFLLTVSCIKHDAGFIETQNSYNEDSIISTSTQILSAENDKPSDSSNADSTQTIEEGAFESNQSEMSFEILSQVLFDLDNNKKEERIMIIKEDCVSDGINQQQGILRIEYQFDSSGSVRNIDRVFAIKRDFTELYSEFDIQDVDEDGCKDIFLSLTQTGSPFNHNYFYIYSYKKNKEFTYSVNNELVKFARSFVFNYQSGGVLMVSNEISDFQTNISINNTSVSDEVGKKYEDSWVEPVPVNIGENLKTMLDMSGNKVRIKIVLPVYGMSTSDFIGTVSVYYIVDEDFKPVFNEFEFYGIKNNSLVNAGTACIIPNEKN